MKYLDGWNYNELRRPRLSLFFNESFGFNLCNKRKVPMIYTYICQKVKEYMSQQNRK